MAKKLYCKRLNKFFFAKALGLLVGLSGFCLFLFFPMIKMEHEAYSFFDLFKIFLNTYRQNIDFEQVVNDELAGKLIEVLIFGIPGLCCGILFLKIFSTAIRFLKALFSINNRRVHHLISREAKLLKNGKFRLRTAKHYRKKRKMKGSAIASLLLIFIPLSIFMITEIGFDLLLSAEVDLQAIGLAEVYNLVSLGEELDIDRILLPLIAPTVLFFINLCFTFNTFIKKLATHYSYYTDDEEMSDSDFEEDVDKN